jgi:hypothetical protein
MRELSIKVWALLRAHPILLLPLACVSVSEYFLEWGQRVAVRKAVAWLTTTHSALEVAVPDGSEIAIKKALTEMLPFEIAFRVLILCAYFFGFVITARLVRSLIESQRCNLANAKALLREGIIPVLLLSLGLLIAFGILGVLGSAVINLQTFAFLRNGMSFTAMLRIEMCVIGGCLVWIFVPLSLRLISQKPSRPIAPARKLQGRIAAAAAGLALFALSQCIGGITFSINHALEGHSLLSRLVVWPGISVLGALPYAALWVYLAVLVYQDFEFLEIPSPS